MSTRVSAGDIILLTVALLALLLLCHFFSPPAWLVFSSIGAGAALPILSRVVRTFLPKSFWSLPLVLVIIFVLHVAHDFSGSKIMPFATLFSAFAIGLCVVEFLLRPFFPLKSREKQT
jgi:hypothetical protein